MEEYGYHCRSYGIYHHDAYEKLPLLKFEIHRTLFFNKTTPVFYRYFKDINNKLIKNGKIIYMCEREIRAKDNFALQFALQKSKELNLLSRKFV